MTIICRCALGLVVWFVASGIYDVAAPARAQNAGPDDFYRVSNVFVDVRAKTELAAKEQAQTQALRRGFEILWQRLTLQRDWPKMPELANNRLLTAVHGVSIVAEKFGGGRYIGNFSVSYDSKIIKGILDELHIDYSASLAAPSVLAAIWQGGNLPETLPMETTAWEELWERIIRNYDNVAVPIKKLSFAGNNADLQDPIARRDPIALARLAGQAGLTSIMVVTLSRVDGADGDDLILQGFVEVLAPQWRKRLALRTFKFPPDQPIGVAISQSAHSLLFDLQDLWKQETLIRPSNTGQILYVHVPIKALADWVALRNILQGVTQISQISLDTISSEHVDISIRYSGEVPILNRALQAQNIRLEPDRQDGTRWQILGYQ